MHIYEVIHFNGEIHTVNADHYDIHDGLVRFRSKEDKVLKSFPVGDVSKVTIAQSGDGK